MLHLILTITTQTINDCPIGWGKCSMRLLITVVVHRNSEADIVANKILVRCNGSSCSAGREKCLASSSSCTTTADPTAYTVDIKVYDISCTIPATIALSQYQAQRKKQYWYWYWANSRLKQAQRTANEDLDVGLCRILMAFRTSCGLLDFNKHIVPFSPDSGYNVQWRRVWHG